MLFGSVLIGITIYPGLFKGNTTVGLDLISRSDPYEIRIQALDNVVPLFGVTVQFRNSYTI